MPGNNKAALIHLSADRMPIMCTIASISEDGAVLTVSNVQGVPDQFQLEVKGEEGLRSCKVAARKPPNRLGISFESQS